MPYITELRKKEVETKGPQHPGELNYAITAACLDYIEGRVAFLRSMKQNSKVNYTMLNDVMGALESAKLEFYRRVVVPYEEEKIKENGDVY